MPQKLAGKRIEPPVSVPSAKGTKLSSTETAEPPEEPPGTSVGSRGFLVTLKSLFSVEDPCAKASRLALATQIAPSASNFSMAVA